MADGPTLFHRWFEEVWNKGRQDVIDELMAEDCIVHGLTDENGIELRGPSPFKAFHSRFCKDFVVLRIDVQEVLVDGDLLAGRCLVTGTHGATGKPVTFTGMSMVRVKNGKFVEAWNNYDFDVMRQQLS
jgi:predicted ester cyclase